jgi:transposase
MNEQSCQGASAEPDFAAFIAIDWADKKHFWSMRVAGSQKVERGELENTPETVEVWIAELRSKFGERPLAVALEQRRGALIAMLSKYEQLYLYPVHPLTLAKYRQAWYPSGSKNDPNDADLLLEILCQHRDRLRRLDPDTVEMRQLQFEVENRRKLVDQRTAISNRVTDLLKLYFPQILMWFDSVDSPMAGDFLERWPTVEQAQKAKAATLEKFFYQHNCRDKERIQDRIDQIRQAVPATHDQAVINAARFMVQVYIQQLAVLRAAITELEKSSLELAKQQPDWEIFASFPRAGDVLAPRLMAAMGSRRDRYGSASELQCFSGIAPVKEASGNSGWTHMRFACPKFMRQSFHEWAGGTIQSCGWARAYYDEQRKNKKSHHTAIRALTFKWQRIIYACWRDRVPYREETYLASLAKRALPLKAAIKSVEMP